MRNGTVNKCYESESCGDFSERICDLNIDEGYNHSGKEENSLRVHVRKKMEEDFAFLKSKD